MKAHAIEGLPEYPHIVAGGRYRHFKGDDVIVLNLCRHSETQEEMVVYYHTAAAQWWVRPLSMFQEVIGYEGLTPVFRFSRVVDQGEE